MHDWAQVPHPRRCFSPLEPASNQRTTGWRSIPASGTAARVMPYACEILLRTGFGSYAPRLPIGFRPSAADERSGESFTFEVDRSEALSASSTRSRTRAEASVFLGTPTKHLLVGVRTIGAIVEVVCDRGRSREREAEARRNRAPWAQSRRPGQRDRPQAALPDRASESSLSPCCAACGCAPGSSQRSCWPAVDPTRLGAPCRAPQRPFAPN